MAGAVAAAADPVVIRWLPVEQPVVVEVQGLSGPVLDRLAREADRPTAWQGSLQVFVDQDGGRQAVGGGVPPMAGKWQLSAGQLRFEPRFPLTPGVRYRAEYRPPGDAAVVSYFQLPAKSATPTTSVTQIFPTAGELPENQLKFYVHFSAPMRRGGTYEHVHLRDASGRKVELPFLELDEELWDLSMTRLTLLIDPGRIKRGVKPLTDVGPVFEAGGAYVISLDAECRDAAGRGLQAVFEKRFRVGPADRTPPDPQRWRIALPRAGTLAPLAVTFDEPMDHALASRLIAVAFGRSQTPVAGEATLGPDERYWNFVPEERWQPGDYKLVIAATIEDLGGNNIGKTFDVDRVAGGGKQAPSDRVTVAFAVQ